MVALPLEFLSTSLLTVPPLAMGRDRQESLPYEAGKGTLIWSGGMGNGAPLELWRQARCSSQVETDISGNFLRGRKGVEESLEVQEGRCDLPRDASAEKGLISLGGENILDFLELRQIPLELRRGRQGPARVASGKASLHAS